MQAQMSRIAELDAIVSQYNLNAHPFYQDWRMGTLPVEKLADYAGEYGKFVGTIAEGWETIGMTHYAAEERLHETMWADFQQEIEAGPAANRPQTRTLVDSAHHLFSTPAEACGALFAFEAQQPNTSQSKLDGLNEHYQLSEVGKEYFRVHAGDFNEVEDLKKVILGMSDAEFARCKSACATICVAMYGALDGIYYAKAA
ncbi:MAG: hypothetical protein HONBIEJF_00520 [Fimbriimonadaceae bacterium]|nr:hypothetical protein [Fimbriimonadaceae bacterium]